MKKILPACALLAGLTALVSSASVIANELFVDINSDSFHMKINSNGSRDTVYALEGLFTENRGRFVALSMNTKNSVKSNNAFSGGLGGKIYALDDESTGYMALSIGGKFQYAFPSVKGLAVSTDLYFAPAITVSDGGEGLVDLTLDVTYDLFESSAVYAGVRYVETEFQNDVKFKMDSGVHAGIKIDF